MTYMATNFASSTLAVGLGGTIGDVTLQIQVGDVSKFPVINNGGSGSDYTMIVLSDAAKNREIIKCTRHDSSSTSFTVERAQEGTSARVWQAGDSVSVRLTAGVVTQTYTHPSQSTGAHAASAISFTPAGSIAATTVQAAIAELDTEKASLSGATFTGPVAINAQTLSMTNSTAYYPQEFLRNTTNDANAGYIGLEKNRAGGIVQNGDYLGNFAFRGFDGTQYLIGAGIAAVVSATPGANDMPTDLLFLTTPDGGAGPSERARIDKNGNFGLGVTPNTGWASSGTHLELGVLGSGLTGWSGNGLIAHNNYYYNSGDKFAGTGYAQTYQLNNGQFYWRTSTASGTIGGAVTWNTAMTLDASGNLLVGSSSGTTGDGTLQLRNNGSSNLFMYFAPAGKSTMHVGVNTSSQLCCFNDSNVGVYLPAGNNAWSSTSDEREKVIGPAFENALQQVLSSRAVRGRYKSDSKDVSRSFLIAQDWINYLPESVSVQPDGKYGMSYTDTIPVLVKAIQELNAKNNALEARIAELEAA